jgi:hypothetical protein
VHALANSIVDNPLAKAAAEMRSGRLQFHFPAREGVQGDGNNISIQRGSQTRWRNSNDGWQGDWCEVCDIEVTISYREGAVRRLRWRINTSRSPGGDDLRDLGAVDATAARDFLMGIVEDKTERVVEEVAENALEAAVLTEVSVPWRDLLALARNRHQSESLRSKALFWLGQEAQEAVTLELEGVVDDVLEDLAVRMAALFALSQRPEAESIPSLKRIALQHRNAALRRNALFWLAQIDAPEVVDFFEEILTDSERR